MRGEDVHFGSDDKAWRHAVPESAVINGELLVSPPQKSPHDVYPPAPAGIEYSRYQLPPAGLSYGQLRSALKQLQDYISAQEGRFLGYQANQALEYESDLKQYLNCHINNIGDPFQSGNFTLNSKWMERAVLDYYASLWNARWPHDPKDRESYWGYVLSMGSTEGNLYGLWNARDYLAGKILLYDPEAEEEAQKASIEGRPRPMPPTSIYRQVPVEGGPNARTPIVFYSEDTHYSIVKAVRVLGIKTFYEVATEQYRHHNPLAPGKPWPKEVPSSGSDKGPGSIDIPSLVTLVEFFASMGYPIIVCFNYGTTFKGAYDDVEAAGRALMPILKKYGLYERKIDIDPLPETNYVVRNGFWFHVDGALGAAYMPFVEMAHKQGKIPQRGPNFDFRLPFVHSISMSGHKWIGAPWPCGVYMSKTKTRLRPSDDPEYLGSQDTTFAGSRNGFSPMILWDYLARNSYDTQIRKAVRLEHLVNDAYEKLVALQLELGQDLWVDRTPLSLTIRFKRPRPDIVFKYSLSNETLYIDGAIREFSHIFIMDHVSEELLNELIHDLSTPNAFPRQDSTVETQPTPSTTGVSRAGKPLVQVPEIGRGFE